MGFKARAQKIRLSVSECAGRAADCGTARVARTTQPLRRHEGAPVRMGRKERGDQNKVLFRAAAGASLARSLSAVEERRLAAKVSLGKCQVLQKREESRAEGEERGREMPHCHRQLVFPFQCVYMYMCVPLVFAGYSLYSRPIFLST